MLSIGPALLILAVVWLSVANGGNDNFKGVATLFGTGTTDYKKALCWALVCTLAGTVASIFLARALISTFTGGGLVGEEAASHLSFRSAVAGGAAVTVLLASRLGFPVSTTHALTGALVGAGFAASGGRVDLLALREKFMLPLLLSPFLAMAVAAVLYRILRRARLALGISKETCLCVGSGEGEAAAHTAGSTGAAALAAVPAIIIERREDGCRERYSGRVWGIHAQTALDRLHFLSAGVVSFARGLNDTPKIAGLLFSLSLFEIPSHLALGLVGAAMGLGALFCGRRVAETMSHKITTMNHGQGFTANLVTAVLVIGASRFGLPVSTTHVSCGSLFGIGLTSGGAKGANIRGIVLAWVITLPLAALCAGVLHALLRASL